MRYPKHLAGLTTIGLLFICQACTSNAGTLHTSTPPVTAAPPKTRAVPPVDPNTQSIVQTAVGDRHHAMLMTTRSRVNDGITGATIISALPGPAKAVDLPALEAVTLVPWSGGYAVGGVNCKARSTEGAEHDCTDWTPTVVFLDPDGSLNKIVSGPEQRKAVFTTISPAGDAVLFRVEDHDWYVVSTAGFTKFNLVRGIDDVCRLRDGSYIGAVVTSSSSDPNQADDTAATMQFMQLNGSVWKDLGKKLQVSNRTNYDSSIHVCTTGGYVTPNGVVDSPSGFKRVASFPADSFILPGAAGIDMLGRTYFNSSSSGGTPRILGGPVSGTAAIKDNDRWVGVSADGLYALIGGPSGNRIVPTK